MLNIIKIIINKKIKAYIFFHQNIYYYFIIIIIIKIFIILN